MQLYLIAGPATHGKTTLSTYLSKCVRLRRASTSDPLYGMLAKELNLTEAQVRALPKEQVRPRLIALGRDVCKANKAALLIQLYTAGVCIIDGLRYKQEISEMVKFFDGRRDQFTVLWVSNPNKVTLADVGDLGPKDANFVFTNSGTIAELHKQVDSYVNPTQSGLFTAISDLRRAFERFTQARGIRLVEAERAAFLSEVEKQQDTTFEKDGYRMQVKRFAVGETVFYSTEADNTPTTK